MTKKSVDTIIIGAGISGLSCAKHLYENENDFLLISNDIGGRILTSNDGNTNYGAFFVCSDYYHLLKYVKLKSKIKLTEFCFHQNNNYYIILEPRIIKYLTQFFKMIKILYKFRKTFRNFRRKSEQHSQKTVIEHNSYLHKLYLQNASDFVIENNLQKGTKDYFSKALYSTTFSPINKMNAFSFLQYLLPLITPIYKFRFEKEKMIKPFENKITLGNVEDITYKNNQYKIKYKDNFLTSKNLVLATEINWSKQYAQIKKTNKPVTTKMYHISATPKKIIRKGYYHLFSSPSNVQAIANLKDDTFLFYYKNEPAPIKNYFQKYKIISSKTWDPAGTINGHTLIESNRGNNLYLIGDFNVAGLEESYITGLYCANQINNK